MDKYIVNLISSNSRVVIPDFGAFIVKQINPKKIVFNEFLKYNDGLLIDFISKKEGVEKDTIVKQVEEYVNKSLEVIDGGGKLTIEGLGTLHKDKLGKVQFEQSSSNIIQEGEKAPATEKVKSIVIPKPEKEEKKPPVEVKTETNDEKSTPTKEPPNSLKGDEKKDGEPKVVKDTKDSKEEKGVLKEFKTDDTSLAKEKKEATEAQAHPEKANDLKPESVKRESADLSSKSSANRADEKKDGNKVVPPSKTSTLAKQKDEEKLKTVPYKETQTKKDELAKGIKEEPKKLPQDDGKRVFDIHSVGNSSKNKRQRKSSKKAVLWGIVALLVGVIAVFVYMLNRQESELKSSEKITIEAVPESEPDNEPVTGQAEENVNKEPETQSTEEIKDEPVIEQQVDKEAVQPQPVLGKKYYIVAGSFKYEKNADKYVLVLKSNGYPSEKFGMINGMYLVSFGSYSNKKQAVIQMEEIRDEFEPAAWMIKY